MPAHRARLPKKIRRKIQFYIRNFTFFALTWILCWTMFITMKEYHNSVDVMKCYGFVPGII